MNAYRADRPWAHALALVVVAGGVLNGCTRYVQVDRGEQAHYQTVFPTFDASEHLKEIRESLAAIQTSATYTTYEFPRGAAPGEEAVRVNGQLLSLAADTADADISRRATAVVVGASAGKWVLLTVNHVVHFPDTIVEYYTARIPGQADAPQARSIRSVSILTGQSGWAVGVPELEFFEVLASDERSDLAFLGLEYGDETPSVDIQVLEVPAGDPGRLSWGSFVYVVGFPAGYSMVTRGVVSDPGGSVGGADSFTIDGVWNRGMSGGLILAVRGDGSGLEWVGTARAAAVSIEHRLVPEEGAEEEYEPWVPYDGPIYLEETRNLLYGITLSVPMTDIRRFADENRSGLRERGYELSRF